MPYIHRIFLLSLSIFSASLAGEKATIPIQEIDESNPSKIINNLIKNKQQETGQPISEQPPFGEVEIKEMEFVFIKSPKEAQSIVNHLQDPSYFPLNQEYRCVIFVGEPGTGKTVMAKAIAHKMTEHKWEYKFLPSTLFLGEHRNKTAMLLQNELEAIKKSKKPTVLIIDELNLLMENSESKNHDTDTTAKALWMFLDQQKNNTNFFFIGTMNRINKLPKAFKSQIVLNYIKFPLVSNVKFKTQFLRTHLTTKNTILDTEVTDEFLDKELQRTGDCSERDLKNIFLKICRTSKMDAPSPQPPLIIKRGAIIAAIDQYLKNKIELDYDFQEETDEERQNRHHRETKEMQEMHFIQQQIIMVDSSKDTSLCVEEEVKTGLDIYSYYDEKGIRKYYSYISDEQKNLYDTMMKKTREREAAMSDEEVKKLFKRRSS